MNSFRLFLIFLIFLILQQTIIADDFSVLALKGTVYYKGTKDKNWQKLTSGKKLSIDQIIKLDDKTYIGLMHKSGLTEELDKAGIYKLADIYNDIIKRKSNITKRFTQFVVNEMSSSDDLLSKSSYRTKMSETGAVTRAVSGEEERIENLVILTGSSESDLALIQEFTNFSKSIDEHFINALYPRDSYIIDQKVTFKWLPKKDVKNYHFVILDEKDNKIFEITTVNSQILVDLEEANLKQEQNYYWHVYSDDCSSNEYCINWINVNNNQELANEIIPLIKEISINPKPLECLSLASYLADRNIMHKAIEFYEKAIKSAPDIDTYKRVYASYLFRVGLEKEAIELLKY